MGGESQTAESLQQGKAAEVLETYHGCSTQTLSDCGEAEVRLTVTLIVCLVAPGCMRMPPVPYQPITDSYDLTKKETGYFSRPLYFENGQYWILTTPDQKTDTFLVGYKCIEPPAPMPTLCLPSLAFELCQDHIAHRIAFTPPRQPFFDRQEDIGHCVSVG